MQNSVVVSSPDVRPSLNSILSGLDRSGLLRKFVTTLVFKQGTGRGVGTSLLARRTVPDWLAGKTDRIWHRELLRIGAQRCLGQVAGHVMWHWAENGFDKEVSRRYAGKVSWIYGMEHSSTITFSEHKKRGGGCILRQVNEHITAFAARLQNESVYFSDYLTPYHKKSLGNINRMIDHRLEQIEHSDLIVANSEHVYDSFVDAGVCRDKLVYVPTGCPAVQAITARAGATKGKLRFIYAGSISLRKGVLRLLETWAKSGFGRHGELILAGSNELGNCFERYQNKGVKYLGVVNKDKLTNLLQGSDVFVLPTLSEGRSHAVLEALAVGLPVITTKEAGCTDVVVDKKNGIVIPAQDELQLKHAIQWCLDNRSSLAAMGACSRSLAVGWTVQRANEVHTEMLIRYMQNGKVGDWRELHLH